MLEYEYDMTDKIRKAYLEILIWFDKLSRTEKDFIRNVESCVVKGSLSRDQENSIMRIRNRLESNPL